MTLFLGANRWLDVALANGTAWVQVSPPTSRPSNATGLPHRGPIGLRKFLPAVRSDEGGKCRVEQVTGLPFAFELAVA
jgi:hypothetical protein